MKSVVKTLALVLCATSLSAPAFATSTCSQNDPAANCNESVEVSLNTDINIDPDTAGVFLQSNTGDILSPTTLTNLVISDGGSLTVETSAIANILNIDMTDSGPVEVRFVSQNNSGNVGAVTDITEGGVSDAATISLTTTAVANNLSISTAGHSLAELGAAQCNTGDVVASTTFRRDPLHFTVNTTAVGNNISISGN